LIRRPILVDTGPLVAMLSPEDPHHGACLEQVRHLHPPFLTCWPVLTEALWLLRRNPAGMQDLLRYFDTGLLRLAVLEAESIPWVARFLDRYSNLGAQLADAALVYLAEREGIDTIFTLDRRDFSVYRLSNGAALHVLPTG
jgi:predicted nucleic acid-binding protein